MENLILSNLALVRTENQTNELNQNINHLIDDLGEKLQKELILMQEKILLKYKISLQQSQAHYRDLQQNRNDQVVQDSVLTLKIEHQKRYHEQSQKALQMNKIYDTLKVELKNNNNYQRELQLQIKYLTKQCQTAKNRAEMLDEQIRQYVEKMKERAFKRVELNSKTIEMKKQRLQERTTQCQSQMERRLRNRIQNMKEYLNEVSSESTVLERIFSKYDLGSYKSDRQKLALIDTVFQDRQFKRYLYEVLYDCEQSVANQSNDQCQL